MLRIIEGWDHINDTTEMSRKGWNFPWTQDNAMAISASGRFSGSQSARKYRTGGNGGQYVQTLYKDLPSNEDILYAGAAIYLYSWSSMSTGMHFYDGGTAQIGVKITSSGQLQALRGGNSGTSLGITATSLVLPGSWVHIGIEVKIDNSVGYIKVWLNGELLLNLTGQDTQISANAYANRFQFDIQAYDDVLIDDVYMGDDTGSYNISWLGDRRVYTIYPNGDGNVADWTANTGNDWDAVNDSGGPDDDTTYIASSTVDQKALVTLPDLPSNVTALNAIQITHYSRKDDSTTRALKALVRSGGSDYEVSAAQYLASTYGFFSYLSEEDPQDSTQWTKSDVDAAEFGVIVDI